jgi:hypothetical protein
MAKILNGTMFGSSKNKVEQVFLSNMKIGEINLSSF